MTKHYLTIPLDLMGLDCPFRAEVEFVRHPARAATLYEPGEEASIEVMKVEIVERFRQSVGERREKLECPDWLSEWIASHSSTLEECEAVLRYEAEEQADHERERLRDREMLR